MTSTVYALLGKAAAEVSAESLASGLKLHFKDETGFSLRFDQMPFSKNKSLVLRWDSWSARINYEDGENVEKYSAEIQKMIGAAASCDLSHVDRRIRAVFANDDSKEYKKKIVFVMTFLRKIEGAMIFDPQQKKLILNEGKP